MRQGHVLPEATESGRCDRPTLITHGRGEPEFFPHLTIPGVGCYLSHRKAWERLAKTKYEWALILEDDIKELAPNFREQLSAVLEHLRLRAPGWRICYLGHHLRHVVDKGRAAPHFPTARIGITAVPDSGYLSEVTGCFAYLLRRAGADELLADRRLYPMSFQVDVALSKRGWAPDTRLWLSGGTVVLATSPRAEEGGSSDVQIVQHGSGKRRKSA